MNVCPACRHPNAEHLPYCAACGRRVRAPSVDSAPTLATPAPTTSLPTVVDGLVSPGLAATIAMTGTPAGGRPASPAAAEPAPGVVQQGARAVGYVFTTIRGR